jgi:uncharacterized protein YjiS (DUF1127 family)
MLTSFDAAAVTTVASTPETHTVFRLLARAAASATGWAERRRQLRALSELDERLLTDVGLAREDVERACTQGFWAL